MSRGVLRIVTRVVVCGLLLPAVASVAAQKNRKLTSGDGTFGQIGPSNGEVVGIAVGIAAVGAAIGIGTYYAIHHSQSITGCILPDADRLQIQSAGDQQIYFLVGELGDLKPGERVRVSGKRVRNGDVPRQFLVQKVNKHYGLCATEPYAR